MARQVGQRREGTLGETGDLGGSQRLVRLEAQRRLDPGVADGDALDPHGR
jgi:hypothetical protein